MKVDTDKLAATYKVKIASKKTHIKNETERLKELEFILHNK